MSYLCAVIIRSIMEKSEFNILSELARGGQKVVYLAEGKQDANIKAVIKEAPIMKDLKNMQGL